MRSKTILITVGETTVVRNIIRTDFLTKLLETEALNIVLVALPDVAADYKKEFGGDRVSVVSFTAPRVGLFEKILMFFERNAFITGTNRIMQHRAYEIGESRIPPWVKECIGFCFERVRPARSLLRFLELRIAPSAEVRELLDRYQPDCVLSTIVINADVDIPILRESRRRGIRSVGMVRGWDNLTTYGIVRVLPHTFALQNEFLREKAIALHDVAQDSICVVGTPDFDKYAVSDLYVTREVFCNEIGVDPKVPIILYAAIGDFLFPKEGDIADMFERLIEEKKLPKCVVLFRAHPAFDSPLERMKGMHHVVPDRNAEYRTGKLQEWDMKAIHTAHLINSIRHAAVVVSAGSTMLIESALMDRPTVAIAFDSYTQKRSWYSVARWSDTATHIVDLLKTGGARAVWSENELAQAVREFLENPEKDVKERSALVKRFAGPNRGSAARALAQFVCSEISRVGKDNATR